MKVISDYHDYYDSVAQTGVDETVVYLRHTKDLRDNQYVRRFSLGISDIYFADGVIGFCGQIYPFVELRWYENGKFKYLRFWKAEDWEKYKADFLSKRKKRRHVLWLPSSVWFTKHQHLVECFHRYKVPIFLRWHYEPLILNPRLTDFGFESVVDPYTAFMRIAGYISGVLGTNKDMPDVTDYEVLRDKKGFDVNSFRRQRGEHRKSRRAKRKNK
jgi:hypothetical protein